MAEQMIGGAVENLVSQFSSAMDCLRELAQNAIDAGTSVVEVWTEYEPGDGHQGTIAIHVDDFGEGMDEAIIDNQLTRLFSSTKERDLTKIGKFGIGFVSVFALKPRAVLLHTGRAGQCWEVLFHEDKSYTKSRLEDPVEGTSVTIFVQGDLHRYREVVRDGRAALEKWCCHAEAEVTFEDRHSNDGVVVINRPFALQGELQAGHDEDGTEVVMAYSDAPSYGFYNRGLTLAFTTAADQVLDKRAGRYRFIELKIKSRHLEPTLSRETVMRDENYEKAMTILDKTADTKLAPVLLDALEALVNLEAWQPEDLDRAAQLARYLMAEPAEVLELAADRSILRLLKGGACTPKEAWRLYKKHGWLLIDSRPTKVAAALAAEGQPTLLGRREGADTSLGALHALARRMVARCVRGSIPSQLRAALLSVDLFAEVDGASLPPEEAYFPVALDEAPPSDLAPLIADAARALESISAGYTALATGTLAAPVSAPPLVMVGEHLGPVMGRAPTGFVERVFDVGRAAAVNRDHPHFRRLAVLYHRSPQLATYALAKDLMLEEDRLLDLDRDLMQACFQEVASEHSRRGDST